MIMRAPRQSCAGAFGLARMKYFAWSHPGTASIDRTFLGTRRRSHCGGVSGYNEVHFIAGNPTASPIVPPALRGAVSTKARGKFEARLSNNDTIQYELSYDDLEGSVTQAHIHTSPITGGATRIRVAPGWRGRPRSHPDPLPAS